MADDKQATKETVTAADTVNARLKKLEDGLSELTKAFKKAFQIKE